MRFDGASTSRFKAHFLALKAISLRKSLLQNYFATTLFVWCAASVHFGKSVSKTDKLKIKLLARNEYDIIVTLYF